MSMVVLCFSSTKYVGRITTLDMAKAACGKLLSGFAMFHVANKIAF